MNFAFYIYFVFLRKGKKNTSLSGRRGLLERSKDFFLGLLCNINFRKTIVGKLTQISPDIHSASADEQTVVRLIQLKDRNIKMIVALQCI